MITRILVSVLALAAITSCRNTDSANRDSSTTQASERAEDASASPVECGTDARRTVAQLGERMRLVSLLAPDSVVRRELADAYGTLASPALLAAWQESPASAPGRDVSNPWPARIEIRSILPDSGSCRAEGDVLYVTSSDTTAVANRRAVTIRLNPGDSMRVIAYRLAPRTLDHAPGDSANDNATAAANVVREYYRDIAAHDYNRAYALWGQSGAASGKTRGEFTAGFAHTAEVHATIRGVPQLEGAAGSEYATVQVSVDAVQRDGQKQRFTGTYTLRRVMADGATTVQRAWHIYTASLTAEPHP